MKVPRKMQVVTGGRKKLQPITGLVGKLVLLGIRFVLVSELTGLPVVAGPLAIDMIAHCQQGKKSDLLSRQLMCCSKIACSHPPVTC